MVKRQLTFEAIALKENVGYASDYERNGLFKVNIDSEECEYLGLFEEEPLNGRRIHSDAVWVGTKIYFIPGSGNRIDVFLTQENRIESIPIQLPQPRQYSFYMPQFKFIKAIKAEDAIWLVPCSYPGIVRLDLKTNETSVFSEWLRNDNYFFRKAVFTDGKVIFAANGKDNAFLIFDTEKTTGEIRHLGRNNNGAMNVCEFENLYWFAPRLPGSIFSWNKNTNSVTEYDSFPKEFSVGDIVFSEVYSFDKKLFFIPSKSNKGLSYDGKIFSVDNSIEKKYRQSTIEILFETEIHKYFREISNQREERKFRIHKRNNRIEECDFYYIDDSKRDKDMVSNMSNNHKVLKENFGVGYRELIRGLIH